MDWPYDKERKKASREQKQRKTKKNLDEKN
jgi:hypothetical protein